MGTHPIFESDFDCLTDSYLDMKVSCALASSALGQFVDYSGYKVFRAEWNDPVSGHAMFDILTESNTVDIWAPDELENIFDTKSVDFMMSSEEAEKFQSRIFAPQFSSEILIDDAGQLITEQKKSKRGILPETGTFAYDEYLEYPELENWLSSTASTYSDNAELFELTTTHEGRKLWGMHIGDKNHSGPKKKVFMECGVHAREWVASATCRYFIHSVLAAANGESVANGLPYSDSDLSNLLDINWYIIVSGNPDGYQYSHDRDRMWRKNRGPTLNASCVGTDLNRNFPIGFRTTGGSTNACSSTFAGYTPLDAIETAAWDAWFKTVRGYGGGEIAAAVRIHSYSQLLMPPWATGRRTGEKPNEPPTIDYLTEVTNKMALKVLQTHGKIYSVGQSRDVVGYAAGGTTEDYAYDTAANGGLGVDLAWVYELRDTGRYGFLLPADQILPTAQEVINSFMALADEIRQPTGP